MSDASDMLAAALEQMDGIIAGKHLGQVGFFAFLGPPFSHPEDTVPDREGNKLGIAFGAFHSSLQLTDNQSGGVAQTPWIEFSPTLSQRAAGSGWVMQFSSCVEHQESQGQQWLLWTSLNSEELKH